MLYICDFNLDLQRADAVEDYRLFFLVEAPDLQDSGLLTARIEIMGVM